MIDKQYDQTSHRVFVHVRWQLPFSHIGIRQRLVWHNLDHSDQVDAGRTGHIPKDAESTSAILKLKPDSEYKLIVSTGPEVIKLFSCSTQLSTKFQLPIKTKLLTNEEVPCFKSLRCCI